MGTICSLSYLGRRRRITLPPPPLPPYGARAPGFPAKFQSTLRVLYFFFYYSWNPGKFRGETRGPCAMKGRRRRRCIILHRSGAWAIDMDRYIPVLTAARRPSYTPVHDRTRAYARLPSHPSGNRRCRPRDGQPSNHLRDRPSYERCPARLATQQLPARAANRWLDKDSKGALNGKVTPKRCSNDRRCPANSPRLQRRDDTGLSSPSASSQYRDHRPNRPRGILATESPDAHAVESRRSRPTPAT